MAITNAQQAKQLLEYGGRVGLQGGGRDSSTRAGDNRAVRDNKEIGARMSRTASGQGASGPVERDTGLESARQRNINLLDDFKTKRPDVNIPTFFGQLFKKPIQKFADFTAGKSRPFFEDVIRAGKIPGLNFGTVSNMTEEELEEAYQNYDRARLSGEIDAYGNPLNQGDDSLPPLFSTSGIMAEAPNDMDQEPEMEEDEGLSRRFRADGGIMNSDVVGGEMDFESARQMYGLGKLVKKVTRTVKKIAKSPIGKAALIGGGLGLAGIGPLSGLAKTKFGTALGGFFGKGSFNPLLRKVGGDFAQSQFGSLISGLPGGAVTAGIAGASLLSGFLTKEQEEEAQQISDETGIDIAEIRANPNKYLARRFRAEGGSTEGKEPVAKKVMPLLDMDGQEKDYRETGGFVDMGRMEKADDVPARLSKNEFVFTADAVRNAGDGSVDKGAEVMYNMMKNLESGGDVSEESQGLEGARKMFQTSQRLEEVL